MSENAFILLSVFLLFASCSIHGIIQDDCEETFEDCQATITLSSQLQTNQNDTVWVELSNGMVLPKVDSLYHWGDMVFSEYGLNYLCPSKDRAAVIDGFNFYWPHGIVPYKYNSNLLSDTLYIRAAMSYIKLNTSNAIKFRPKKATDTHYIEFKLHNQYNDSYIGMQQGGQIINIHSTHSRKIIMHEILHSLGFFHEHCRADRDDYININRNNVRPDEWYNFERYPDDDYSGMDFGSFDFNSIMLYSSKITDTLIVFDPTINTMTKKADGSTFTQGTVLSIDDIKGIKAIYGPPYHRLESHRLRIVEDEVWGFIETFITEHADSIIFYSDASCTTRESLPFPRKIKVLRTVCTDYNLNYHYDYSYLTVTVPAGTSAYCLWQSFNYECYYCSDPYNYRITSHEIVNEHLNGIYVIHE